MLVSLLSGEKTKSLDAASANCPSCVHPASMAESAAAGSGTSYYEVSEDLCSQKSGLQLAFHCTEPHQPSPLVQWVKWLPGFPAWTMAARELCLEGFDVSSVA